MRPGTILANISVRTRIVSVFLTIAILSVLAGTLSLRSEAVARATVETLADKYVDALIKLNGLSSSISAIRSAMVKATQTAGTKAAAPLDAQFDAMMANFRDHLAEIDKIAATPDERASYRRLESAHADYVRRATEMRAALAGDDRDRILKLYSDSLLPAGPIVQAEIENSFKVFAGAAAQLSADSRANGDRSRLFLFGFMLTLVLVSVLAALALLASVALPIDGMTRAMRRLADNDTGVAIPCQGLSNELGRMAAALDVFKRSMLETARLQQEREEMKARAAAEKQAATAVMADMFETGIGAMVGDLAAGNAELRGTARDLGDMAGQFSRRAASVAAAAEQASNGVGTVAAAAEELGASVREISRQMARSREMTTKAVEAARRTDGIVRALADGARKIDDVVGLIATIAGQTNLLALNATIEAARAGDAGKGFAVVASEVKSLATQTATATQAIGTQISEIQAATEQAVKAIRDIRETIGETSAIVGSVAAAMEQQGGATEAIARNVQQTAEATREVTANVSGVSKAADETGRAADNVLHVATKLSKSAASLSTEVDRFVARVRSA